MDTIYQISRNIFFCMGESL